MKRILTFSLLSQKRMNPREGIDPAFSRRRSLCPSPLLQLRDWWGGRPAALTFDCFMATDRAALAGAALLLGWQTRRRRLYLAAVSDSSPAVAEPGVAGATVGKASNT